MRTLLVIATTLAVLGLAAAPTAAADPIPDQPGFGTCTIQEQSVGVNPVTGEDITVPNIVCYW